MSWPALPPPATSLLPPHDRPESETPHHHDGQSLLQAQQQRRARAHPHAIHPRSELAMLSYDERLLTQRKLAIQMYGYSWLKPAGCTKTMLGRREEEIEREEVERQLREVELQERNAAEMEETEAQALREGQRAREAHGEDIGGDEGERDLDEDVPDMDAQEEFDDAEGSEEDEDEGEVDLDDDVPEADSGWGYDTTRDPETDSEDDDPQSALRPRYTSQLQGNMIDSQHRNRLMQSQDDQNIVAGEMPEDGNIDEYPPEHDLDDDLPDMDESLQDLDDDVPDADEDDGGWEHTDTELEESDMDISIMPPGVTAHHISMPPPSSVAHHQPTRARQGAANQESDIGSGLRRTSGNVPLPMGPPAQLASIQGGRRGLVRSQQLPPNYTPDQIGSDFSVSALISTGNTDMSTNPAAQAQRSWLDPASARRNLFGGSRNVPTQNPNMASAGVTAQQVPQGSSRTQFQAPRQASSGGLFTPSPNVQRPHLDATSIDEPRSRTRSGRATGRNGNVRGVAPG